MYVGDYDADATVKVAFVTNDKNGAAVAPSDAFEVADFKIYKNTTATERADTTGYAITTAITGLHTFTVDTSDNTVAGFFATGNDYFIVLDPDETVDSETIEAVVGHFSIANRTTTSSHTTTDALINAIPTSSGQPSLGT